MAPRAFHSWERIEGGGYRCYAERTKFLNYEVEPALDMAVEVLPPSVAGGAPSQCVIRMVGARLGGSAAVQQQSQRFAASATHVITWEATMLRSSVEMQARVVHVCACLLMNCRLAHFTHSLTQVDLELFSGPFALLPRAAVERPGAALLQRVINKSLTPFLAQLEADYRAWEAAQSND